MQRVYKNDENEIHSSEWLDRQTDRQTIYLSPAVCGEIHLVQCSHLDINIKMSSVVAAGTRDL